MHYATSFRVGLVAAQDVSGCRVRVTFLDRDQMQSWWLPVIVAKTQNDKAYHLPDLGEQVVCLMDASDEDGAVVGAIYSSADKTPTGMSPDKIHWSAKDGASFEYDRAAHALNVSVPGEGTLSITAGGASIVIDASGTVQIIAAGQIQLGSGTLKGVARLGDQVTCPAGTGTIVSASTAVEAE